MQHWDVIQAEVLAENAVSGNNMWPIEDPPTGPSGNERRNKQIVYHVLNELINFGNISVLEESVDEGRTRDFQLNISYCCCCTRCVPAISNCDFQLSHAFV